MAPPEKRPPRKTRIQNKGPRLMRRPGGGGGTSGGYQKGKPFTHAEKLGITLKKPLLYV